MIITTPNRDQDPSCAACSRETRGSRSTQLGRPLRYFDVRLSPNENYAQIITLDEVCLTVLTQQATTQLALYPPFDLNGPKEIT